MKARRLRRLLAPVALLALAAPGQSQTFYGQTFYGIIKAQQLVQTSSAAPRLENTGGAVFSAILPPNTPGALRLPSGSTVLLVAGADFARRFDTLAELDAAFPAGNYTLTVGTAGDVPFALPANPYPSTIPQVTGGIWSPSGDLVVDPARDTTLTISTYAGYGTEAPLGNIRITIFGPQGQTLLERQEASMVTPAPFASLVIPAGTLVAGRRYSAEIQFLRVAALNPTAILTAVGVVGGVLQTQFFVQAAAPAAPTIGTQPVSQTIGAGGTVAFSVAAAGTPAPTFQWRRGTTNLPNETRPTLVLSGATTLAGPYSCVATNDAGSTTSDDAVLTVSAAPTASLGRLTNLSVLAPTGPGERLLTMGATVGGGQGVAGVVPLVIRGIGPALRAFDVTGFLADPVLAIFPAGTTTASATNDNWGGTASLAAAFAGVGAFELPAASLDSAALQNQAAGGFTVQVAGKGTAAGTVLAEVYDAAGNARTATTPRLTNLSTLTSVVRGATLSVGFVIGGTTARTVLVRAAGPTLGTAFAISGVMADPRLEVYHNDRSVKIAENDNWGGSAWLVAAGTAVGAFPFGGATTRDAALLITLAPGAYSARVSGVGTSSGTTLVEVYEVP